MATKKIQSQIDSLAPGTSLFNLAVNVAGIIEQKKNVSIWTMGDPKTAREVLTGSDTKLLNAISNTVGLQPVILRAQIRETSRLAQHPIEDGSLITDHKVKMPTEINIIFVLPGYAYEGILEELREYYTKGTLLSVHTKGGIFNNMVVRDMPHDEAPENVDRLIFNCVFQEALIAKSTVKGMPADSVADPSNASQEERGLIQGTPVSPEEQEAIARKITGGY